MKSPEGSRLFELGLSDLALALCAAGSPEDQRLIDSLQNKGHFVDSYLAAKGIDPQQLLDLN